MKLINKLVRDKIPEIITTSGQKAVTEILTDERYRELLDVKLNEECTEYQNDKTIEELVDMLEVIYAIAAAKGYSEMQLNEFRMHKADERGAYKEKIYLQYVLDESGN